MKIKSEHLNAFLTGVYIGIGYCGSILMFYSVYKSAEYIMEKHEERKKSKKI